MGDQSLLVRILKAAAGHIPVQEKKHRQFIAYQEFLDHREYELALDSLVELVAESHIQMLPEFWKSLSDAAMIMQLHEKGSILKSYGNY